MGRRQRVRHVHEPLCRAKVIGQDGADRLGCHLAPRRHVDQRVEERRSTLDDGISLQDRGDGVGV